LIWYGTCIAISPTDGQLVRAKSLAPMYQRDVLGRVDEVDDPVERGVAAPDDHHPLAFEHRLLADDVVHAAPLPRRHVIAGQLLGLERSVAAGDDHRAGAQLSLRGVQDDEALVRIVGVGLPRDLIGGRLEVNGHVELVERLLAHQLDEVAGEHARVTGHVEDPLLRVQRRELAAELRQRVDHARRRLAHPGPERRREPHGAGTDHGDVADFVEVARQVYGVVDHVSLSGGLSTMRP
jgi:hypothetical protein